MPGTHLCSGSVEGRDGRVIVAGRCLGDAQVEVQLRGQVGPVLSQRPQPHGKSLERGPHCLLELRGNVVDDDRVAEDSLALILAEDDRLVTFQPGRRQIGPLRVTQIWQVRPVESPEECVGQHDPARVFGSWSSMRRSSLSLPWTPLIRLVTGRRISPQDAESTQPKSWDHGLGGDRS